ncbi:MAG: hypothetical protein D4R88_10030 [Methanosarcinales archaeon]|nr:MAG: hypothetical protein D4R88_10030 [Methanosarcinales archaeon]
MNALTDKLFVDWKKGLKPKTASTYGGGVLKFCDYTGKTPSELINEAREDYINRVAPWEIRHVKAIEDFVSSLDGSLANWTKLGLIKGVKHFYKFYKIPVYELNKHNIPSIATETYLDLPAMTIEDIRKAVQITGDNRMLKALILTFLSSGQGQAEIHKLKGKHIKNIVNDVAIVNMTRGKTNTRYTFFISNEALEAIKDYKPKLKDDELIFTQQSTDRSGMSLSSPYVGSMFARHSDKLGFKRGYFAPHRFRHFFKTQLTGLVDATFLEYWMGHKLPGVEANYFIGTSIQDRMLDAYIKNLDKLTVFTDQEVLQKQYDELKQKHNTETESIKIGYEELKKQMELLTAAMQAKQQA